MRAPVSNGTPIMCDNVNKKVIVPAALEVNADVSMSQCHTRQTNVHGTTATETMCFMRLRASFE